MSTVTGATTHDARPLRYVYAAAIAFCATTCAVSYAHWANFEYRTFDLAYYVQAIWQLIHGRFAVSVEHVPLLGNHVEPIVFLFAPLFAVFQHPMLFVVVQNAALATMAPAGFKIARHLGVDGFGATLLAVAILLAPAAGYIALHEFHPEALAAPFLLLVLHARMGASLGRHWLWFVATLSCKENMALVLAAYCVVNLVLERRRSFRELRNWYGWPLAVSIGWFVFCTKVITPALNGGDIDYLALYSHLGSSAGEIAMNAFREPQRILGVLWQASRSGNLIWGLLLPFLLLPLLRLRWLIIASPILLQHLLSWRPSEWTIYFHYAAPLLPLLWIAMAETVARLQTRSTLLPPSLRTAIPALIVSGCVVAQAFLGPASAMADTAARWRVTKANRERKDVFISVIPPNASVVAPLPYLSHLATRENLYSLHYILKGLKTLSRAAYVPPAPTDFVLIDYADTATFDSAAGYYHPAMRTADGHVVPSSDQLLHQLLRQRAWNVTSANELVLLTSSSENSPVAAPAPEPIANLDPHTVLLAIGKDGDQLSAERPLQIQLRWRFDGERELFPWMTLVLAPARGGEPVVLVKGLCAPEAASGPYDETWKITSLEVPPGEYSVAALFRDNAGRGAPGNGDPPAATWLCAPIPLGRLVVLPANNPSQ